jgi:hypothetical protein
MLPSSTASESSVNIYQTTQHHMPEDSSLHSHTRENVKPHNIHAVGTADLSIVDFIALTLTRSSNDQKKKKKKRI